MGRNGGARLELTWIGKNDRPRLEPRILIESAEKSYHAATKRDGDIFDNVLVHGDNLLALKALEADYAGKVKCIYIDPPYNTGSAFQYYDDGVEHSVWLSLMRDRLELLRKLLRDDGFIFVQIDNNEMAYLKVLMDEVFGRTNFINDIVWKRRGGSANPKDRLNNVTDFILWYAKGPDYRITPIFSKDDENTQQYIKQRFTFKDADGRLYRKSPLESPNPRPNLMYDYKGYRTPKNGWSISREMMEEWDKAGKLDFPADKTKAINRKAYLDEYPGQPVGNLWTDISVINPMSKERLDFDGQKPEALLRRILELTTAPGDWILDSFAGSGTTGAAAHKMGRRWIMVELGDHAVTHILPRLKKVIDGEDKGGLTEAIGWSGGGGFRFYHLAPSLLEQDKWGNWVIAKAYNATMLAEAMCRHMGFNYAPSRDVAEYWKHGHSSERDFIFITTASLTHDQLKAISHDVGPDRTLLICCKAFNARLDDFENLTVKKIPHAILNRCEWGRDDYSLEIANLPPREPDNGNGDSNGNGDARNGRRRGREKATDNQPTLFGEGEA